MILCIDLYTCPIVLDIYKHVFLRHILLQWGSYIAVDKFSTIFMCFLHYFQRSYVVYPPEGPRPPSGDEIRDLIKKNKATPSWIFGDGCGARIIKQDEVGSKSMVWSWQVEDQSETCCKWPFVYPLRATFGWRVLIQRLPQLERRSWQRIEVSAAGKCVELFMTSLNLIAKCNITGILCTHTLATQDLKKILFNTAKFACPQLPGLLLVCKVFRTGAHRKVPQRGVWCFY